MADLSHEVRFICPCGMIVETLAEGILIHMIPACERFMQLDPLLFLQYVNNFYANSRNISSLN